MIEEAVVSFLGERFANIFFGCTAIIVFTNIACGSFYFWTNKSKNL